MADRHIDPNTLNKLRVIDLKEHLGKRGLPTSGLKADLVKRLKSALLQETEDYNPPYAEFFETEEQGQFQEAEVHGLSEEQQRFQDESIEQDRQKMQEASEEFKTIVTQSEDVQRIEVTQRDESAIEALEEEQRILQLENIEKENQMMLQQAEEERLRRIMEERAEEERLRKIMEEKAEEEHTRMIMEEQARAEEERMRKIMEEQQRAEEERMSKIMEEQKRAEEEQQRRIVEEKRRVEEEHQRRIMEEKRRAEQEHQRRIMEERERAAEEEHARKLMEERERDQQRFMLEEQENHLRWVEEQKQFAEDQHHQFSEDSFIAQDNMMGDMSFSSILPPGFSPLPTMTARILPPPPPIMLSSHMDADVPAPGTMEHTDSLIPNESQSEMKLPQALEKVLALKTERAQLLGVDPDAVAEPLQSAKVKESPPTVTKPTTVTLVNIEEDENDAPSVNKSKESKSRRRKKKKKKKHQKSIDVLQQEKEKKSETSLENDVDVDIEYVQDVVDLSDPLYSQFVKIFEKFKLSHGDKEKDPALEAAKAKEENINPLVLRKKPMDLDDDDFDDDKDMKDDEKMKLSKRKLKKLSRMSVAELKQKVSRPELVEMHDVTAKDPVLLLHLKASRNTVPVPRHWCFKRKYLQGKRGIEKLPFELPDFIKRTGIMEMRQALQEKEDQKTMKAKMRERVRPKMGKIDIDYQKLHDAFFKWQTKPRMTIHGDLYYEGKEFETRLKEKKPGDLSEDMRTALGMPTGTNANKCPPPWLIAMQRYGPPPSYPNLRIPGLNAPIPDSCSFGYHAGGWGKPPVDETGRPLYGDVFGTLAENMPHMQEEELDHTLWGELESESSEEEEEEEEDEEEEEEKVEDETGLVTPAEGLITPSGFSSIPTAGMETPDMIELRKRKIESEMGGGDTPALYTILPEKKGERIGASMMGSTHIYDLAGAIPASKLKMAGAASGVPHGVEVALDPSELELDTAAMAARYEQTMREQQSQLEKEDLSDMVAEHAARQKNKRKKQQMDSAKPPKKYKEFKF